MQKLKKTKTAGRPTKKWGGVSSAGLASTPASIRNVRVAVFAQGKAAQAARAAGAEHVGFEDLIQKVIAGLLDFDIAIATPEAMTEVRRLGRYLGPRGLMPNPRTGTVTEDTADAVMRCKGFSGSPVTDSKGTVVAVVSSKHTGGKTPNESNLGIVESFVHRAIRPMPLTSSLLIDALREGLPFHELDELRRSLDLPMDKLVPILGISKATLHRRKTTGRLDLAESDRVVRYARLLGTALDVLESIENARLWLTSPQVGLGGAIPLEYAETEVGAREVENLLGRIEYGVYS